MGQVVGCVGQRGDRMESRVRHRGLPADFPRRPASTREARGPTKLSNWVVPGVVLVGAHPYYDCVSEEDAVETIKAIIAEDITTFASLCCPGERRWRSYERIVRRYLPDARFVEWPVPDGGVIDDGALLLLLKDLYLCLQRGERLYIHCWAGHGRTGTIASILLGDLYNLSSEEAMLVNQRLHNTRWASQDFPSPATSKQVLQVQRILDTARDGIYFALGQPPRRSLNFAKDRPRC